MGIGAFLKARLVAPIREQLRRGLSPDEVALTVAVGLCIAVNPVVGVTTVLSFTAAWALRLNVPIIQAINWSSYPLQLVTIIPFIRLGERIFRAPRLTLSVNELVAAAKTDPLGTVALLAASFGRAVVAWLLVAPLIGVAVYFGTRPLLRALASRVATYRRDLERG